MLKDKNLKEYKGIKIITSCTAHKKEFKYFTVQREFGIQPLKEGENFYMYHHFELDSSYGWNTITVTKI